MTLQITRPAPKPARAKLTVADYMQTPDDERYQLIDGELILAPSPTDRHQRISARLALTLMQFVTQHGLGVVRYAPLDVTLANDSVFQPDILFISNERLDIIAERIEGAPDLVVEILSPSTRRRDLGVKLAAYSRHGVREYWIVDPAAETVAVLSEGASGLTPAAAYTRRDTLTSPLLPGLAVELAQVFPAI